MEDISRLSYKLGPGAPLELGAMIMGSALYTFLSYLPFLVALIARIAAKQATATATPAAAMTAIIQGASLPLLLFVPEVAITVETMEGDAATVEEAVTVFTDCTLDDELITEAERFDAGGAFSVETQRDENKN